MIPEYPDAAELTLPLRVTLHPLFRALSYGISEFTFANLYLFRKTHHYKISMLPDKCIVLTGKDTGGSFFMLPFTLPADELLNRLFFEYHEMRCVSPEMRSILTKKGYSVVEDRDNFDYLYLRENLSSLSGRRFHKKRNLIKAFVNNHAFEGRPLLEEHISEALSVLEIWQDGRNSPGDYSAVKEGLEKAEELQLCGAIYYVENSPVAFSLGEELAAGRDFVVHFEKAVPGYKGIWQFVNQAFASILPEQYLYINREQDLGEAGLRQAKLSYKPDDFIKKYKVNK